MPEKAQLTVVKMKKDRWFMLPANWLKPETPIGLPKDLADELIEKGFAEAVKEEE